MEDKAFGFFHVVKKLDNEKLSKGGCLDLKPETWTLSVILVLFI